MNSLHLSWSFLWWLRYGCCGGGGHKKMTETSFALVIAMVKARLREAAATLKRMRLEKWDYPSQHTAWWPDIVRQASDAYGYDKTRIPRTAPAPKAIDSMEEVLEWMLWLEHGSQRLVWARASKMTWSQLEMAEGRSRETLRKEHDAALGVIVGRLAESPPIMLKRAGKGIL